MRFCYIGNQVVRAACSAAAILALGVTANAQVQQVGWPRAGRHSEVPCNPPCITTAPHAPTTPAPAPDKKEPAAARPAQPPAQTPAPATEPSPLAQAPTTPELGAALGGEGFALASSGVGYIDSAVIRNTVRLRVDAAYDNNRPDRAEFFYPKCGCFADPNLVPRNNPEFDANAPGPPLPESRVDYTDVLLYVEGAFNERFSAFIESPYRMLNPEINQNASNFGDITFGGRGALIASPEEYLTFQLRMFVPTGNASRGLGTNHVSIEPAILYYRQLSDRAKWESELRQWVPVGGTDFQGNVIRYGTGVSYAVAKSCDWDFGPVGELVGWTVFNGKQSSIEDGVETAGGDTIVNFKVGARLNVQNRHSLYFGYGRPLTGEVWYKNIYRLEYRLTF